MINQRILIIDDDLVFRETLKSFLEAFSYEIREAESIKDATKAYLHSFDAIISEGDANIDILTLAQNTPVIVTSSKPSLRSAVSAMKKGAADYLPKPYNFKELKTTLETLCGLPNMTNDEILGESKAIRSLASQVKKVGPTDTNVLLEGEPGTGKALVARKIHQLSKRARSQIISINCAATPDSLIETELFSNKPDATGHATNNQSGLAESAVGATLFLKDIEKMPMTVQSRLLRLIERNQGGFGARPPQKLSIRIIASTNKNLPELISRGRFLEDLYYRLNVINFWLPPLRERGNDRLELAKHFLKTGSKKIGRKQLMLSQEASKRIESYSWPGNIRELENAVQRAVILSEDESVGAELLPSEISHAREFSSHDTAKDNISLEGYFINFVLANQERMTETDLSQTLGISRKALWQKRQKLNIPRKKSRRV